MHVNIFPSFLSQIPLCRTGHCNVTFKLDLGTASVVSEQTDKNRGIKCKPCWDKGKRHHELRKLI